MEAENEEMEAASQATDVLADLEDLDDRIRQQGTIPNGFFVRK